MFTHVLIPMENALQTPRVLAVVKLLAMQSPLHDSLHDPFRVTLVRATSRAPESAEVQLDSNELGGLVTCLRDEGIDAHSLLNYGTPEAGILDAAQQTQADLIVLMPHGRHGLGSLTRSSVTAKLLASATVPLLIWPERLPEMYAQDVLRLPDAVVILPLDGGERAERARPYAVDLANTFERPLVLLRVTPDLTPPLAIVGEEAFVTPDLLHAAQEEARHYLTTVRERHAIESGTPIQSLVLSGPPARRILDLADVHPGSVIVMSTDGRGALARATLGSVTSETLHHTTTPVILISPHAPPPLISATHQHRATAAFGGRSD
jgi:nucleotide-binding universal stress UspA family protein